MGSGRQVFNPNKIIPDNIAPVKSNNAVDTVKSVKVSNNINTNKTPDTSNTITTNNNNKNTNNKNVEKTSSSIGGVIYRAQIGSASSADSKDNFKKKFNINEDIFVDSYNGAYKYSVGTFFTYAEAKAYANQLNAKSALSSFVIAFKDGKRITVAEAKAITKQ